MLYRLPEQYASLTLPHKLPPTKDNLSMTSLPMLGYMEQNVATALIKAMTSCGNVKPKYPFLNASRSALFYIAYHLKGKSQMITPHSHYSKWNFYMLINMQNIWFSNSICLTVCTNVCT